MNIKRSDIPVLSRDLDEIGRVDQFFFCDDDIDEPERQHYLTWLLYWIAVFYLALAVVIILWCMS